MKNILLAAAVLAGALGLSAQESDSAAADPAASDAKVVAEQLPSYPLDVCVVSGKELGSKGDPVEHVVDGRLVRLCCAGCVKTVESHTDAMIAKVDAAVVREQKPTYPLDVCVVSGEKLGAMGEPVEHVDGTRLVRLCCEGCIDPYAEASAKYLAKVDAALIADQKKTYPLDTCPISGKELGAMGEPVDHLYGVQLVRFCCKGCVKPFRKAPAETLAKIEAARESAKEEG